MAVSTPNLQETLGYSAVNVDNGVKVGLNDNAVVGIVGAVSSLASQSIAQAEITKDIVAQTQATTNNILATNESIFSLGAIKRNWVIYAGVGILALAVIIRITRKGKRK